MNIGIIDAIIILFVLLGGVIGFKEGVIKKLTSVIGLVLVVVLSFMLKNKLSIYFYENLPFFDLWGIFKQQKTSTVLDTTQFDEVIFENGQGLLLNDTGLDIAGTTPSKTTAEYALRLATDLGCDDICIHYVTRPYLTRHGKGYLTGEQKRILLSDGVKEDRTNTYNIFQDDFRFGELDLDAFVKRIQGAEADIAMPHTLNIDVTHCDEMDRVADFKRHFANVTTYDSALII